MAEFQGYGELDDVTKSFYQRSLQLMGEEKIPFLVGGAYALAEYTGIVRHTKDLDLFILPSDAERTLRAFSKAGFRVEMTDSIWLGKAFSPDGAFVDFIFRSGNGISEVDEDWFRYASTGKILDQTVKLCPPEETIWSKGFIMERERFDGADVAHYLLAWGPRMDWNRLLSRFGSHWRVLLSHFILFGFVYPDHRDIIPSSVMNPLLDRVREEGEANNKDEKICRGTLLSRVFYLVDIDRWGYRDGRFEPRGSLTEQEIEKWATFSRKEAPALLKRAGISLDETKVPQTLAKVS